MAGPLSAHPLPKAVFQILPWFVCHAAGQKGKLPLLLPSLVFVLVSCLCYSLAILHVTLRSIVVGAVWVLTMYLPDCSLLLCNDGLHGLLVAANIGAHHTPGCLRTVLEPEIGTPIMCSSCARMVQEWRKP
jgi:hypothetical protein